VFIGGHPWPTGFWILGMGIFRKFFFSHGCTRIHTDEKPEPQILRAGISGEHFCARRYAASTVGFELEHVRQSIREQEPRIEQTGGSEPEQSRFLPEQGPSIAHQATRSTGGMSNSGGGAVIGDESDNSEQDTETSDQAASCGWLPNGWKISAKCEFWPG
jgi:hypothetical protein